MQNKKMMSQFSDHVLGTDRRTDQAKKKKKKLKLPPHFSDLNILEITIKISPVPLRNFQNDSLSEII